MTTTTLNADGGHKAKVLACKDLPILALSIRPRLVIGNKRAEVGRHCPMVAMKLEPHRSETIDVGRDQGCKFHIAGQAGATS